MKETIKIAVSKTLVNTEEKEIDFPETAKYYTRIDDGYFFPEGEILFAIIPRRGYSCYYTLVRVTGNTQEYDDFNPRKDCRDEYWLEHKTLRHEALEIIRGEIGPGWIEITQEEFDERREILLNEYKEHEKWN